MRCRNDLYVFVLPVSRIGNSCYSGESYVLLDNGVVCLGENLKGELGKCVLLEVCVARHLFAVSFWRRLSMVAVASMLLQAEEERRGLYLSRCFMPYLPCSSSQSRLAPGQVSQVSFQVLKGHSGPCNFIRISGGKNKPLGTTAAGP